MLPSSRSHRQVVPRSMLQPSSPKGEPADAFEALLLPKERHASEVLLDCDMSVKRRRADGALQNRLRRCGRTALAGFPCGKVCRCLLGARPIDELPIRHTCSHDVLHTTATTPQTRTLFARDARRFALRNKPSPRGEPATTHLRVGDFNARQRQARKVDWIATACGRGLLLRLARRWRSRWFISTQLTSQRIESELGLKELQLQLLCIHTMRLGRGSACWFPSRERLRSKSCNRNCS